MIARLPLTLAPQLARQPHVTAHRHHRPATEVLELLRARQIVGTEGDARGRVHLDR